MTQPLNREILLELATSLESVWQQARENHERHSATGSDEDDIRFLALGLTGEDGELANFVKKRWRDGDDHAEDIRKEIADVCAYAFMLADRMGLDPSGLIAMIAYKQKVFLEKMALRAHAQTPTPSEGNKT